ncbi:MAG TPA: hypothetical protein V6C88_12770 [Chroococcidiopsis sp.]
MNTNPKDNIFRQKSLERLSSPEQLDQLMQVVNPRSWLSLAALGSLVLLTVVWSIVGRIPITATGKGILVRPSNSSSKLVGLIYFDGIERTQIQPGMAVTIIPDGVEQDKILGRVKAVSDSPITTLDAARQAKASNLLETESIEVLVELEPNSSTQDSPLQNSSIQDSSIQGTNSGSTAVNEQAESEQAALAPGMTATARILLAQKAPIAFAFPFIDVSR